MNQKVCSEKEVFVKKYRMRYYAKYFFRQEIKVQINFGYLVQYFFKSLFTLLSKWCILLILFLFFWKRFCSTIRDSIKQRTNIQNTSSKDVFQKYFLRDNLFISSCEFLMNLRRKCFWSLLWTVQKQNNASLTIISTLQISCVQKNVCRQIKKTEVSETYLNSSFNKPL